MEPPKIPPLRRKKVGSGFESFIRDCTTGFEQLREAVKKVDLTEASGPTGISLNTIYDLAQKLGTVKPASIDRREGGIHQANGTQINRALAILTAITGNVDISGGLIFTDTPNWNNTLGITNTAAAPSIWEKQYPLAADNSQAIVDAILEERPYPIKGIIFVSGNPVSALPHTKQNYPNKIVTSHTGINVEDRKAHPRLIGELAGRYTMLKFVMVHTGVCPGSIGNDYHLDAIEVMRQNKNVFGVLSMVNPASVLDVFRAVRDGVIETDQVFVGSDFPYNKAIGTLDSRYNLANHPELDFSEPQLHMIMSKNADTLIQQSKRND